MLKFPVILKKDERMPLEIAKELFGDTSQDEICLETTNIGPWRVVSKVRGLVCKTNFNTGERIIYGFRKMSRPRQLGYELEGRISIKGKQYSAFTSSTLFELENGHLINVGTIFPRID